MRHIDVSGVAISSERSIACTRWFRWQDGTRNILFQYMIALIDVRDDVRDIDRSVMCHYVCDGVSNILCNITRAMLSVLQHVMMHTVVVCDIARIYVRGVKINSFNKIPVDCVRHCLP